MATNSLIFDTHKAVSMLEKRGLSTAAAEGITELVKEVTETNLVTKNDLEIALNKQSVTLMKWVTGILMAHAVGTAGLTVTLLELLD